MKWILYNNKRYLVNEPENGVYHIADEPYKVTNVTVLNPPIFQVGDVVLYDKKHLFTVQDVAEVGYTIKGQNENFTMLVSPFNLEKVDY